jgi:hypothetical protein
METIGQDKTRLSLMGYSSKTSRCRRKMNGNVLMLVPTSRNETIFIPKVQYFWKLFWLDLDKNIDQTDKDI